MLITNDGAFDSAHTYNVLLYKVKINANKLYQCIYMCMYLRGQVHLLQPHIILVI